MAPWAVAPTSSNGNHPGCHFYIKASVSSSYVSADARIHEYSSKYSRIARRIALPALQFDKSLKMTISPGIREARRQIVTYRKETSQFFKVFIKFSVVFALQNLQFS